MKELLIEKGYKNTKARLVILEVFSKNHKPQSTEEIYKQIRKTKEGKNINEATVYRTLADFTKNEILKRVDLRKDSVCYELVEKDHHHHHIVCTKCNKVEDFENKEIEKILINVVKKSNFKKITEHSLELFGLCRTCI